MTHGSLFSGIGGFDLAAEWAGWDNIFHCEWNPFGQKVLKYHFPNSISYHDITKTDFTIHKGRIDIISGGFPCQPYSTAGLRKGKEDERHLWPQMLRAIREIQPSWVVGENVRGLINWGGGLVFDEVQTDLENEGYEVLPFLLPACAVNAPHRRDRIWFIAHSNDKRGSARFGKVQGEDGKIFQRNDNAKLSDTSNDIATNSASIGLCGNSSRKESFIKTLGTQHGLGEENVTDSEFSRLEYWNEARNIRKKKIKAQGKWSQFTDNIKANGNELQFITNTTSNGGGKNNGLRKSRFFNKKSEKNKWDNFPTQSPICGGNDGIPRELDGITFSKWRNESIKAYGNAIVPQVAFEIFKAINEYNIKML